MKSITRAALLAGTVAFTLPSIAFAQDAEGLQEVQEQAESDDRSKGKRRQGQERTGVDR